jgi:hypothetical protein
MKPNKFRMLRMIVFRVEQRNCGGWLKRGALQMI